jgi:hypothetical protein
VLEAATAHPDALAAHLAANTPPILCSQARRHEGLLILSPAALAPDQPAIIGARLAAWSELGTDASLCFPGHAGPG